MSHCSGSKTESKRISAGVILPQLSGVAAAGPENRMDKVHTLQLEGYRKFNFMLIRAHAAPCGECSYYVDATR